MTMENLLYYLAQGLMMPSLSAMYSKCCLPDAHVRSARDFANHIQQSAMKRITENEWLSAEARRFSREKISHMDMRIAETDSGSHYKLPELSEIDIIFNVLALGRAATGRAIHYALHPALELPVMDANFEVNAHYYTSGNRLVIPGGITLWPFYDSAAGRHLGWCYGGLGAVVGHEMLHGFDEDGSRYNQDGVYRPWWSKADLAAYAKRTKALIRLFSSTKFLGRYLNGKSTLSENIADLGGLAIALDALKREMTGRRLSEAAKKKELRDFFISYATSWRTKERRQQSLYRLFTDSHAPAEVRVNRIVSHFQEWYDIFGVTAEDALYIDPKDRIAIF
jgi:putative endopeptidase